jgi:hypothetical protein
MTWSSLPSAPRRDSGLDGYLCTVGHATLVGGHLLHPRVEDATKQAWTVLPRSAWGELRSQTVLGNDTQLLVWGGSTDTANTDQGYLLTTG